MPTHRIVESLRLEKTTNVTQSNHQPIPTMPTTPTTPTSIQRVSNSFQNQTETHECDYWAVLHIGILRCRQANLLNLSPGGISPHAMWGWKNIIPQGRKSSLKLRDNTSSCAIRLGSCDSGRPLMSHPAWFSGGGSDFSAFLLPQVLQRSWIRGSYLPNSCHRPGAPIDPSPAPVSPLGLRQWQIYITFVRHCSDAMASPNMSGSGRLGGGDSCLGPGTAQGTGKWRLLQGAAAVLYQTMMRQQIFLKQLPQNHRTVGVGSYLWRSSSPRPCWSSFPTVSNMYHIPFVWWETWMQKAPLKSFAWITLIPA